MFLNMLRSPTGSPGLSRNRERSKCLHSQAKRSKVQVRRANTVARARKTVSHVSEKPSLQLTPRSPVPTPNTTIVKAARHNAPINVPYTAMSMSKALVKTPYRQKTVF